MSNEIKLPEDNYLRKINYLNMRHQGKSDYVAKKVSGYVPEPLKPMSFAAVRAAKRQERQKVLLEAEREESNAMAEEARKQQEINNQRELDAQNSNKANNVGNKKPQQPDKSAWGK